MGKLIGTDVALTGVPRGGTTLCCQLLQRCAETVALFEPMDVAALPDTGQDLAVAQVMRFFSASREQILRDGNAPSKQLAGQVPDNPFSERPGANGRRELVVAPGLIEIEPRPAPGFTLVIKHNAAFTALLPELAAKLRTLAIVRHPLSVLASWNSVDLPVSSGRLPAGERLDPMLAASIDLEPDRLARQLLLLEWFYSRFDRHLPAQDVLRYEDVVASQGELLRSSAGVTGGAVTGMVERNSNPLYSRDDIPRFAEALASNNGSWQRWYRSESIAPLARRMLAPSTEA